MPTGTLFASAVPLPNCIPISDGSGTLDAWLTDGSGGIDLQAALDALSSTRGAIIFRGASDWVALPPGVPGEFLMTNGSGADPDWVSDGTGGGGGAPVDAEYIVRVADGDLPNAQVLAALATGLLRVATTTGVLSSITTSAGIAALISDKTGTAFLVFSDSPVFTTQATIPKIVWTGAVTDIFGAGSPEGVVTAAVGSVYRRTDGGASTTVYVKESGAGNTGWIAVGGGSSGDVVGPASSVNNELAVYDSTTGKLLKAGTTITATSTSMEFGSTSSTALTGRIRVYGTSEATSSIAIRSASNINDNACLFASSARGSLDSPSAINSGDSIFAIKAGGYDSATWQSNQASFFVNATENWSGSARGTVWKFGSTPTGTTSQTVPFEVYGTGIKAPLSTASTSTSTGALVVTGGVGIGGDLNIGGNVRLDAAKTLSFASGSNQRAGNAVLVAGTVTVSNTTVTANTIVMLTRKTSGGTIGAAITYTLSAGASFTINSDNPLDTSTFSYLLIEAP